MTMAVLQSTNPLFLQCPFLGTVAAHQPSTGSPMMTGPLSIAGPIKIAIINKIHMKLLMRHIKTYMNYINNDKIDIATP